MNINEEKFIDAQEPTIKPNKLLLIDADIMYYRAAWSAEDYFDFGTPDKKQVVQDREVILLFDKLLAGVCKNLNSQAYLLCWTLDHNYRTEIDPMYKANRKDAPRPACSPSVKEILRGTYPSLEHDGLEADDLMGLHSGEGRIIVSDDKDLLTVPGLHYQPRKPYKGVFGVSVSDADYLLHRQILEGDRVDGYKGIPGVGPKKAEKILTDNGVSWRTILKAYEDYGLHDEDALVTARLARILRPGEYDWITNKPKLWSPEDVRTD